MGEKKEYKFGVPIYETEIYGAENLICPYCGEEQYCHEPEEFSSYCINTICEHCGRKIEYSVDVTRRYYPEVEEEAEGNSEA